MMEPVSIKPTLIAVIRETDYGPDAEYINPNSISRMSEDKFGNYDVYYSIKDENGNEKFYNGKLSRHIVTEHNFNIIG